nr:hypothetical protein [Tanacetum cinerariifolium]
YHLEEVYKATTDQLDWVNPEGQQYPHNLLQPLSLIPDNRGRRVIPFDHFINNDLEFELVKDAEVAESEGRHDAQQEDDSEVQEVVKVVTTAKLITEVVTAAASQVSAASATIPAAKPTIPAVALTVVVAYIRRRKGVIIKDPEEELPLKTLAETP